MEIRVRLARLGARTDLGLGLFDRAAAEEMVRQFRALTAGCLYGQFANTASRSLSPTLVDLSSVTHAVTSVWIEGGALWGTVRLLTTPMGDHIRWMLDAGIPMDFWPRVCGSWRQDGTVRVERFVAVDVATRDVQGRRQERIEEVMGVLGQ